MSVNNTSFFSSTQKPFAFDFVLLNFNLCLTSIRVQHQSKTIFDFVYPALCVLMFMRNLVNNLDIYDAANTVDPA